MGSIIAGIYTFVLLYWKVYGMGHLKGANLYDDREIVDHSHEGQDYDILNNDGLQKLKEDFIDSHFW